MTNGVAESISRGLEEAIAYGEGTANLSLYDVHIPETLGVKAIRTKTGKTTEVRARRPSRCPLELPSGDLP